MCKPHKHAAIIKAWADGAQIEEYHSSHYCWLPIGLNNCPIIWSENAIYRVQPRRKPDVTRQFFFDHNQWYGGCSSNRSNIVCCFDGETNQLKSVELLK